MSPNILVICSDEHHPGFAGYRGHPFVRTPNLDRLARQGTRFTRACCNSPVCTPSRMSFITGKYVHEIGSWMIGVPLDPAEMTWPRALEQAGIPTTMLGKMDFCGPYQDGGFGSYRIIEVRPAWKVYPRDTPWAARLEGYTRRDKRAHLLHAGVREDNETDGHHGHDDKLGFYDHDRHVTDWALEYLREKGAHRSDTPWHLYVGLLYPHWPFCVPRKYFDMYYPDQLRLPHDASFPNENLHPALRHFQRALDLGEVTEDMVRRTVAAYQGMITCMDDMIGRILDELDAQGLADDTYVIYTSDHGESLGDHGLFYKQCSYEGPVGVPLIIRGPDIPWGKDVADPVSLVDLYPSVLDMAGLDWHSGRPGVSWLPLVRGQAHERPDYAFSEFHGNFFKHDWYMLVRGRYKYTYYSGERPSLFDVAADPLENNDVAGRPENAGVIRDFEATLRSIVDPEEVSRRARRELGLLGPNGEDYTQTLTVAGLLEGREKGIFPPEPGALYI